MSSPLSFDELMAPDDLGPKLTEVPGVGSVWIRALSESEKVKQVNMWGAKKENKDASGDLRLTQLCLCSNEAGEAMLTWDQMQTLISVKGSGYITKLVAAVLIRNGYVEDSNEAAELTEK